MSGNNGKRPHDHGDDGSQSTSNEHSSYSSQATQYATEDRSRDGVGMSYSQGEGERWEYGYPQQNGYVWPGYGHGVYGDGGFQGMGYGFIPQMHGAGYPGQQHMSHYGGYSQYGQQWSGDGYSNYGHASYNTYGGSQDLAYGEQGGQYSNYDSRSYGNYRQDSRHGGSHRSHHQQTRGYASQARQRAGMPSDPTPTSRSPRASASPPRTPPRPTPPRRTEPTEEYLAVSQQPSSHVDDPSSSRKLVVLDLNGSLLLRSAHQRRPPQARYGGGWKRDNDDPYADPTKLRPLRTVHRRPYLGAFTSYILHDKTKEWLDTMVWSSAQPHSVDDMVDRCFGERRSELRAVWARDTLGLAADDYHKKSLTLKDLEKPWAELPYYRTSTATGSSSSPDTEAEAPEALHHSALSTVLVDDSPLKAKLQPWNHLVIREYLQQTRNMDLRVVGWEEAKERLEKSRQEMEALENAAQEPAPCVQDSNVAQDVTEAVPQDAENEQPKASAEVTEGGEVAAEGAAEAEGSGAPTGDDTFVPNQKRKMKKLAKKERARQEREEKEREAFAALRERQHAATAERLALAQANGQIAPDVQMPAMQMEDAAVKKPAAPPAGAALVEPELKYDETLLAVVGVLDHLKHETNVSGWMRSGGLINTALAALRVPSGEPQVEAIPMDDSPSKESSSTTTSAKHDAPSRGSSPSEHAGPPKKRRMGSGPEDTEATTSLPPIDTEMSTEAEVAPAELNSSPTATEPPLSRLSTATAGASSPALPPSEEQAEQAETGVPLSAPVPTSSPAKSPVSPTSPTKLKDAAPSTTGSAGLWYENEAVLSYWAEQGRKALAELGIEADSGMRTPPPPPSAAAAAAAPV